MKLEVPSEWIEKWITKGGRKIPIVKKKYRKYFLWMVSFVRKSPIKVVDSRTVNKALSNAGFESYHFLEFPAVPPPKVRKEILAQMDSFLNVIKGTPYEKEFQQISLSFHRATTATAAPYGFYTDANILRSSNSLERMLTKEFYAEFSAVDRARIRTYLGIKIPRTYGFDPEVVKFADLAFPQGSGAISIQVYPVTHHISEYGHTFLHEAGHFIQSRFSDRFPGHYVDFGSKVYAPYISRVLPDGARFFDQSVKNYGRERSCVNRNFVRLRFYRELMRDPLDTPVLTLPSLQDPEEGFSEAFAFYANADPEKRRILRIKWPEAYDYFDFWLKGRR